MMDRPPLRWITRVPPTLGCELCGMVFHPEERRQFAKHMAAKHPEETVALILKFPPRKRPNV